MQEIPEITLGTALFSIVEPHEGHEREFHRWYERDHFFAGCMIGANYFSGRRFVATRKLKALRFPADTPVTPDIARGSYLVLYWILAGAYPETLRWSVDQVLQLHRQNRMQPPRDNISTAFYRYAWGSFRDPDGVPPELALEHPYKGVAVTMIDRAEDVGADMFEMRLRALLNSVHAPATPPPSLPHQGGGTRNETLPLDGGGQGGGDSAGKTKAGSVIAMSLCLRPQNLPDDAPSYVPRPDPAELDHRYLLLSFLEDEPGRWVVEKLHALDNALEAESLGRVVYAAPFIPTVPGTDKYVDEL